MSQFIGLLNSEVSRTGTKETGEVEIRRYIRRVKDKEKTACN